LPGSLLPEDVAAGLGPVPFPRYEKVERVLAQRKKLEGKGIQGKGAYPQKAAKGFFILS
jgi:hypothetical protein